MEHGGSASSRGPESAREEARGTEGGTELRRGISRKMLLFFIVGDMLGGGIYALVGEVGGEVGGAIWTSFMLALLLALFTAGAYAELTTKYPRAGGAAYYINRAFRLPLVTFLVTFAVMASGITSASALARGFSGDYFTQFIQAPALLVALVFILIVALVNFRGIVESVRINVGFTIIEIGGLLLIVLIGIVALASGVGEPGRAFEFKEGSSVPILILAGAALGFYALIGFEDSANVAEEVKEPGRAYPLALFGGLLFVGILYFLVTFTASMVVETQRLAQSSGPLIEVVEQGPLSIPEGVISAIALFALANGALINMIMASRLLYGMSRERILPGLFGRVHRGRRTPWFSIVFTTALAVVLIITGGIEALANATVTLLLFAFILVNVSVLVLRRDTVEHDHFVVPVVIPIIGILVSIGLLTQQPVAAFIRAGIFLAIGLVLWLINRQATGGGAPRHATAESA